MPGHKMGKGIPPEFLKDIADMDLTEIPGLDNLHKPDGVILEAQKLAAVAFGADKTYFLVNGSTAGIHTAISTVCKPGEKMIVSRDCHRSVIGGLMLSGSEPVYVLPEFDSEFGISSAILPQNIDKSLTENPDAVAVLVTRPNYYGICCDITEIAKIVHSHNKILIVDEAHGAHFKFNDRLPICGMDAGADICIQSAHKTLPAFTQGAYLHIKFDRVDSERLEFNLGILQTSSPSYVIMAFLDIAREIMQTKGKNLLDNLIDEIELNKQLHEFQNIKFVDETNCAPFKTDLTRVTFNVSKLGITGYEVEGLLRKLYNIQVEMADYFNVVCISTVSDTQYNLSKLFSSLKKFDINFSGRNPKKIQISSAVKIPEQRILLRDAMQLKRQSVPLREAEGKISGGIIAPYPPGIPALLPGEVITSETVSFLQNILNFGASIEGIDKNLEIKVIQ